jgi:hypothetical protein
MWRLAWEVFVQARNWKQKYERSPHEKESRELFRQALESYCEQELTLPETSRFDDIIGIVDVPGEFSIRTRELFGKAVEEKVRGAVR